MTVLEQILLVIVAFATFLLLIFTIVLTVLVVTIMKRVRQIADRTRDSVEHVADMVDEVKSSIVDPVNVANFVTRFINKNKQKRRGK